MDYTIKSPIYPRHVDLLRHAHSLSQQAQDSGEPYTGGEDPALSELGERQAETLGRSWRGLPAPDAVISSSLQRARSTAAIACAAAGWNVDTFPFESLIEQRYGVLSLLSPEAEIQRLYPELAQRKFQQGFWFFAPPGGFARGVEWPQGESWEDVTLRQIPVVEHICHRFAGSHIKIFSHGSAGQCLRLLLEGLTPQGLLAIDLARVTNCCETTFENQNGKLVCTREYYRPPEVEALT